MKSWGAAFGSIIWGGLFCCAVSGWHALGLVELLFLFAPLVVVPLGLNLLALHASKPSLPLEAAASQLLPFAALLTVISFYFKPGTLAACLAGAWLLFAVLLGLSGAARLLRGAWKSVEQFAPAIAFLYLPVGGAWLVASRAGLRPLGFAEPIVLLTAMHFHFAGFAAPIIAGALGRALAARKTAMARVFPAVAAGVIAGPGLLAAGFIIGPGAKLAGACLVAISEFGLGIFILSNLHGVRSRLARVLLTISSLSVIFSMVMAATWAIGEYPLQPFLDLARMEKYHGVANALGFVLCGLLGLAMESRSAPTPQLFPRSGV